MQNQVNCNSRFILSILYNFVGFPLLYRKPFSIIAAILMPASSISIVLLVTLLSSINARRIGLGIKE